MYSFQEADDKNAAATSVQIIGSNRVEKSSPFAVQKPQCLRRTAIISKCKRRALALVNEVKVRIGSYGGT